MADGRVERLRNLAAVIRQASAQLRELSNVPERDFLADRLSRMATLRNLLVHMYWKIDNARIYRVIREDLGDYDAYLAAVGRFLAAEL